LVSFPFLSFPLTISTCLICEYVKYEEYEQSVNEILLPIPSQYPTPTVHELAICIACTHARHRDPVLSFPPSKASIARASHHTTPLCKACGRISHLLFSPPACPSKRQSKVFAPRSEDHFSSDPGSLSHPSFSSLHLVRTCAARARGSIG
jgi:hypothetical protein